MSSYDWPGEGGGSTFTSIEIDGATSGALTLTVPAIVTSYTIKFPSAQGTGALVNDGSGNLSWSATGGITFGNLTDAGTDGITVTGGTGAVKGSGTSIAQRVADSTHNGYLSSADWTTFNNKQSTLSLGNLTDAGTDGIVVTGGTGAVVGSGTSIAQQASDGSHNGYLSSSDWTTFNNKQSTLTLGNLTDAGTDGITVTGGTGAVVGSGTSIAQRVADTTHNGYLSSTDWNTFNAKGSVSSFSVAATPAFLSSSVATPSSTPALTLGFTATGFNDPKFLYNLGLLTAVSSGTLTVSVKQSDGSTDCTSGSPAAIAIRNSTATSGSYNVRSITAALSQTIQAGTQLSYQNYGAAQYLWVHAIDSDGAGAMKIGLSSARYDDGTLVSTVTDFPVVTISNASPGVITLTGHGYNNGDQVSFKSVGGTLPTGITADNVYFVVSKAANTFQISNSYAGGSINTSSAGSGVFHVLCADNRMISDAVYASKPSRLIGRLLGPIPSPSTGWGSGFTEVAIATPAVAASISPTGGLLGLPGRNVGSTVPIVGSASTTTRFPFTISGRSDGTFDDTSAATNQALSLTGTAVTGALPITKGGTGQPGATAAFNALSPLTTLGDVLYGAASGAGTRLAGNTTSTKNFLAQTGTGTVSAAPVWGTLVAADIPSLAASIITSGALATARGGTNSDSSGSTGIAHVAAGSWTYSAVALGGSDVSGTLPMANGGTGTTAGSYFRLAGSVSSTTSGNVIAWPTSDFGGGVTVSAGRMTVDKTGIYWFASYVNGGNANVGYRLYLNGSASVYMGYSQGIGQFSGGALMSLTAADIVDMRPDATTGAIAGGHFECFRVPAT